MNSNFDIIDLGYGKLGYGKFYVLLSLHHGLSARKYTFMWLLNVLKQTVINLKNKSED